MRHALLIMLALAATSCTNNEPKERPDTAPHTQPAHASGASGHKLTRPEQIQWRPATALPPGAQIAILEGDPDASGFVTMRLRLPDGYRVPPHFHPCIERATVLAGTLNLGRGEQFDKSATEALPPGTYTSMPAGMRHFAWTTGPTELQLSTIGPWGITYVNPADDPRIKPR